jgi:hypothetical protein
MENLIATALDRRRHEEFVKLANINDAWFGC